MGFTKRLEVFHENPAVAAAAGQDVMLEEVAVAPLADRSARYAADPAGLGGGQVAS